MEENRGRASALLPIGVFLVIFLGAGIITGDFYAMPAIVAFLAALFVALGMLLPFLTGQIPQIGSMLLPMHIPVLLCRTANMILTKRFILSPRGWGMTTSSPCA